MTDDKKPASAQFKPDFSLTVVWPVTYVQTEEDGEQRDWKIPMRWNRPTSKDAEQHFKLQRNAINAKVAFLGEFHKKISDYKPGDEMPGTLV